MTLRQLFVRIKALPVDSLLWSHVRAEAEVAEARQQVDDIDAALAVLQPRKE